MTHGSLFSGIGGFDLAAEWMGWKNIFHCEWNPFGQKVLKYHFPNSISYEDITKTDFTIHRGRIDILTGGFPCQPYSTAGKRLGKEDERHLWPEMLRAIREIQPGWVVGENVLGLVNWSGGLVFHEVQADLEAEGYEVQPYVLPACAVNAPHVRQRIWFVAYSKRTRLEHGNKTRNISSKERETSRERSESSNEFKADGNGKQNATDTSSIRWENRVHGGSKDEKWQTNKFGNLHKEQIRRWQNFPTVSPICTGDDGISDRLDSITFSKWRNESIKAGGNAIVPQVVYQIFKAIEEYETQALPGTIH
jgi:DNA (cytosine-5)-methyltransferase 1